jgi:Zn-dependent protease
MRGFGGRVDLSPYRIAIGLTSFVVLLFSLSFHEAAHAWTASRLGDDTARREGRVSLNPVVHIDPFGTLLFPLFQIFTGIAMLGWAKPTPYEPRNFDRRYTVRQGHVLVAAAGPLSNVLLAIVFTGALFVMVRSGLAENPRHDPLVMVVALAVPTNVALAIFNLVPIPPLDGSKAASYGLPSPLSDRYDSVMEPYGFLILFAFILPVFGGASLSTILLSPFTNWFTGMLFRLAGA